MPAAQTIVGNRADTGRQRREYGLFRRSFVAARQTAERGAGDQAGQNSVDPERINETVMADLPPAFLRLHGALGMQTARGGDHQVQRAVGCGGGHRSIDAFRDV
jgi:hypothetical protein